jgi:Flp pilus assembly protein TadD
MATTNLKLEMVPLDEPKSAPPAQNRAVPPTPTVIEIAPLGKKPEAPPAPAVKADPFLTEATHQYREGHLDQPLWERAMAQANGDKEAAIDGYLRSRAMALRLLDRRRRAGIRPDVPQEVRAKLHEATNTDEFAEHESAGPVRPSVNATHRNAIIAGALLLALAVVGGLAYVLMGDPPAESAAPRGTPAVPSSRAAAAAKASTAPVQAGASPELMQKIQELRTAENWNVLVFYLVEWTRKEPANPTAWDELRAAYLNLKQHDDALSAAKKAAELAPEVPRMWRNLGAIYVDIDDPEKALRAFEQAAARDSADAESLRQVGILNAQLGRAAEAKVAFDQVLVIAPGDAAALCMRTAVALLSTAPKDAYATAKQAKVIAGTCRK